MRKWFLIAMTACMLLESTVSNAWNSVTHRRMTANAVHLLDNASLTPYAKFIHSNSGVTAWGTFPNPSNMGPVKPPGWDMEYYNRIKIHKVSYSVLPSMLGGVYDKDEEILRIWLNENGIEYEILNYSIASALLIWPMISGNYGVAGFIAGWALVNDWQSWTEWSSRDDDMETTQNFVVSSDWPDCYGTFGNKDEIYLGPVILDHGETQGGFWTVGHLSPRPREYYEWAVEEWRSNERVQALRWLGRACHFVQDGTYTPHTVPNTPYGWMAAANSMDWLGNNGDGKGFKDTDFYPHVGLVLPSFSTHNDVLEWIDDTTKKYLQNARDLMKYCDGWGWNCGLFSVGTPDNIHHVCEKGMTMGSIATAELIGAFWKDPDVNFIVPPSILQATRVAEDTVYLSWKDNSTNEKKFLMYRTENPQDWDDVPHGPPISDLAGQGSVALWSEIDVIRGQSYWYRVTAAGDEAHEWSEHTDSIKCDVPFLNAPTQLSVTPKSYNQAEFRWHDNSIYDAHFKVEPGGIIVQGNGKPRGNVSDIRDCQKLDEERTFSVRAVDENGDMSSVSNDMEVHCRGIRKLWVHPLDGALHLRWCKSRLPFDTKTLVLKSMSDIQWTVPDQFDPNSGSPPSGIEVIYYGDGTEYLDSPLQNGTPYHYKVFQYSHKDDIAIYNVQEARKGNCLPTSLCRTLTNAEEGMGYNNGRKVAVADNTIGMIYSSGVAGKSTFTLSIYYVESVDGGANWDQNISWVSEGVPKIGGELPFCKWPAIAFASDGTKCAVWTTKWPPEEPERSQVYYSYKQPDEEWTQPTPLFDFGGEFEYSLEGNVYSPSISVAGDPANDTERAHIAVSAQIPGTSNNQILYVSFEPCDPPSVPVNPSTSPHQVSSGIRLWGASVAVDGTLGAHVLWQKNREYNDGVWHSYLNGNEWSTAFRLDDELIALWPFTPPSVVFSHSENKLYATWGQWNTGVYVSDYDGTLWSTPESVNGEVIIGDSPYPVISAEGDALYIAWRGEGQGETSQICAAKKEGSEWEPFVLAETSADQRFPHIDLLTEGENHYLCGAWAYEKTDEETGEERYFMLFWRDEAPDITVSLPTASNPEYAKWRTGWSLPFRYEMDDNMEVTTRELWLATTEGFDVSKMETAVTGTDGVSHWSIPSGLVGDYTIKVKAWDNLGNVGESWSEIFTVKDMLVFDPGFEEPPHTTGGDNVPPCWVGYGPGTKDRVGTPHSGDYPLHLHAAGADNYFGIYQQRIPCEPNTTYWLSGWMKTEGVTDGQASMALGVWEPYSNHADFGYLAETTEWTYVYGAWTSGPDETEMRISLYGTPGFTGDAYFDDLELTVDEEKPLVGTFYAPGSFQPGQDITLGFGALDNVAVEEVHFFYASNKCGPWSGIGSVNPRKSFIDFTYGWIVPSSVPIGKRCFLRMVVVDPQGNTDSTEINAGVFVDTQDPQVSVLFPTASANVGIGDACPLAWNATDNGEIEFDSFLVTHNYGGQPECWRFIGAAPGRDTTFDWVVGGPPSNEYRIKAISYDMAGNKIENISDANFSVCGLASSNKGCTAGPTKLQVDSQGKLHLVFAKDGFVYYATRNPGDEIWTRSILGTGTGPSISYNDNWIAMTWADGNELWYTTVEPNSQEPGPAQKLVTLLYSPLKPSIVLDGSSPPVAHIAWSERDRRMDDPLYNASTLCYGTLNVGDVSTFDYSTLFETPDSFAYADPWIDVDESNTPHMVAVFPNNSICYLVKQSGNWIIHEIGSQGSHPSIDIKDQHVYLVWENSSDVWATRFPATLAPSPEQAVNISSSSCPSASPVIVSGHALWSEGTSATSGVWQIYHSRFNGIEWTDAEDIDGSTSDVDEHFPQGVMEDGIGIQQDLVRYATLHRVCASGTEERGYEIKYGSDVRMIPRLLSGHISEDFEL